MSTAQDAPRKDDGIVNCAPWPTSYRAETDACSALEPRLERQRILNVAPVIAGWFLDDDPGFGRRYYDIVVKYRNDPTKNYAAEYLSLLGHRFPENDARAGLFLYVANEHDFANVHRSVWLLMTHALARLLNFNLHGDWGEPPGGATTQGRYEDLLSRHAENFHTTPNLYGSYAISSGDVPPPDLGVGEAIVKHERFYRRGHVDEAAPKGTTLDLRDIARKIARALADRDTIDKFGQHPYHREVKRYYFDHQDHTSQYAAVIGGLLHPTDPDAAAALACRIGADEFADIHRGAWLFLAHRFHYLVGVDPFGDDYGPSGSQEESAPGCAAEGGRWAASLRGAEFRGRISIEPRRRRSATRTRFLISALATGGAPLLMPRRLGLRRTSRPEQSTAPS